MEQGGPNIGMESPLRNTPCTWNGLETVNVWGFPSISIAQLPYQYMGWNGDRIPTY